MKVINVMMRKSTIAVVVFMTLWIAFILLFPSAIVSVVSYSIAGYFIGGKACDVWDHFEAACKERLAKG